MANRNQLIEGVIESFHAIKRAFMEEYYKANKLSITPSQGLALRFVSRHNTVNVKEIAQALNVTSSAATQLINGLVKNEFLVRSSDLKDRREMDIKLSKKALKHLAQINKLALKNIEHVLGALSDNDLLLYSNLNNKILNSISRTIIKK